ncbi:MAG: hypothetical protein AAGH67_07875 [Cyanobacteria bacterium P01_H01_bin.162]
MAEADIFQYTVSMPIDWGLVCGWQPYPHRLTADLDAAGTRMSNLKAVSD